MKTGSGCLTLVAIALSAFGGGGAAQAQDGSAPDPAIIKSEFIAERPPVRSAHASTLVETRDGLLAAWFGGTDEGNPDVSIWLSRNDGHGWTPPDEIANGVDEKQWRRYPCWNPVLFYRKNGDVLLFYKVGPSPEKWWGMVKVSADNGQTWSAAKKLPGNIVGPVRNKPVELPDGTLVCGASTESAGWRVHMERTKDPLKSWDRGPFLNVSLDYGAIQPTLLRYPDGRLQALCRTKQQKVVECWSSNNGATWSRMTPTRLPNPNSALDAVLLRDGLVLLAYNHSTEDRRMLNVAGSSDGRTWHAAVLLEHEPAGAPSSGSPRLADGKTAEGAAQEPQEMEYSYPAIIQTSDGMVHATYTWRREKIKHVVIDPSKITLREMPEGRWP